MLISLHLPNEMERHLPIPSRLDNTDLDMAGSRQVGFGCRAGKIELFPPLLAAQYRACAPRFLFQSEQAAEHSKPLPSWTILSSITVSKWPKTIARVRFSAEIIGLPWSGRSELRTSPTNWFIFVSKSIQYGSYRSNRGHQSAACWNGYGGIPMCRRIIFFWPWQTGPFLH
jgi:hypothetical protein